MVTPLHNLLNPCQDDTILSASLQSPVFHNADNLHPQLQDCVAQLLSEVQLEYWYSTLFQANGGKMFGVLIVEYAGKAYWLKAFSGLVQGQSILPGYVPPVCDTELVNSILVQAETDLNTLATKHDAKGLEFDYINAVDALRRMDTAMHQALTRLHAVLQHKKLIRKEMRIKLNRDVSAGVGVSLRLNALDRQSQQDKRTRKQVRKRWQRKLDVAKLQVKNTNQELVEYKKRRQQLSADAQKAVFALYKLANPQGKRTPLLTLFSPDIPPAGSGDCAAPKLLHFANQQGLRQIALAECWVGAAPSGSLRRHGFYYPPCRSKCGPLLPYLTAQPVPQHTPVPGSHITILFEDKDIAIIEKPAGLLSTPGKRVSMSVLTQCQSRLCNAQGPILVHRLDMDTSGLMVVAKNSISHRSLQKQFQDRTVIKKYVAELNGTAMPEYGVLDLPLRVDLDDRPRQRVCKKHGASALTHFRVLEKRDGKTRMEFQPVTGRTHQIRVHAAHPHGLNAPVVGDSLYGRIASRLHLHACFLEFRHPVSNQLCEFTSRPPF